MRLIDANKIVYSWQIDADGQEHDGVTLQSIIDKMPTINPEPWNKGKWIIDGHHIKCNRCENTMCSRDREGDLIPRNFCPNCGAEMREGDSE